MMLQALYRVAKPVLLSIDPEGSHHVVLKTLGLIPSISMVDPPGDAFTKAGLTFGNRVSLAAGFDKNAIAVPGLTRLGFGSIEVGGITPRPQMGSAKPRLFRLNSDQALINRMGFNNEGVERIGSRLSQLRPHMCVPLGANLGINRDTPIGDAAVDFTQSMNRLYDSVDYFVINISSPNTEGLRSISQEDRARALLGKIVEERQRIFQAKSRYVPCLVKLSPDDDAQTTENLVRVIEELDYEGIIATNSTLSRGDLKSAHRMEAGGLSGKPLFEAALAKVAQIRSSMSRDLLLIGCGGVMSLSDAQKMRRAGADLVQLYTGMIFNGPEFVEELASQLT